MRYLRRCGGPPILPVMGGASSSDRGLRRVREPATGQGPEVWNSVPLRVTATVQGWLRKGRVFCGEGTRTNWARILDGDKLQVAVFQHMNFIDGVGVVVAAALDCVQKHRRPLKAGLLNDTWALLDQVSVRREVDGPILKEVEVPRCTGAL